MKKKTVKDKKNKKAEGGFYELCVQTVYLAYFYLVGFLLTLYVRDAYFDILEAKADCFSFIVKALSIPIVVLLIYRMISKKKTVVFNLENIAFFSLIIFSLISTALSVEPRQSFFGTIGWHIGFMTICFLALAVLLLKETPVDTNLIYYPLMFVCLFEYLLTISDAMKMDIFHFRDVISKSGYFGYYATIGNCDWYVGYLSLTVPLFLCLYLKERERNGMAFFYLLSFSGIIASVLNGADGIYLAYGFLSFFTVPFILKDLNRIKRFVILALSLSVSFLIISMLPVFEQRLLRLDGFGRIFFDLRFIIPVIIACTILVLFITRVNKESFMKVNTKLCVICEALLGVAAFSVLFFLIKETGADFGNGRLEIWQESFRVYTQSFTLKRKLFGIGPEMLEYVYGNLSAKYGIIYNSSHNEAIHVLLSLGIFGLTAWILCWIVFFGSFFRNRKRDDAVMFGLYAGLLSYFGQSFVNSTTTLNLAVLSIFAVVLFQCIHKND